MMDSEQRKGIRDAVANPKLQLAVYSATARLKDKRSEVVAPDVLPEYQELRTQANRIKRHALENLDFTPEELGPDMPVKLEDRLLEFWNLVFMQEELSAVRAKDDFDVVGPLPRQNIDTGMGLERVAFLLQDVDNMYEIDVMFPVIVNGSAPPVRSPR